jgi:hypothetical protein
MKHFTVVHTGQVRMVQLLRSREAPMLTAMAIAVAVHDPALKLLLATLAIGPLAGYAGIVMFRRWRQKSGECKPKRAIWKQFDDTHH